MSIKTLQALTVTAEITGTQFSATALEAMDMELSHYDEGQVLSALRTCYREVKTRLTLAHIIEKLESINGYVTADEAWATYPHDESKTAVVTEVMHLAMGLGAQDLLNEGDKVGARMAFKSAYDRLVDEQKAQGVRPQWIVTLGHDKLGREPALKKAVQMGLIKQDYATALLPAPIPDFVANGIKQAQYLIANEKQFTEEERELAKKKMT